MGMRQRPSTARKAATSLVVVSRRRRLSFFGLLFFEVGVWMRLVVALILLTTWVVVVGASSSSTTTRGRGSVGGDGGRIPTSRVGHVGAFVSVRRRSPHNNNEVVKRRWFRDTTTTNRKGGEGPTTTTTTRIAHPSSSRRRKLLTTATTPTSITQTASSSRRAALVRLRYSQNGDPLDLKPTTSLPEEELVGMYHLGTTAATTASSNYGTGGSSTTTTPSILTTNQQQQHDVYQGRTRSTSLMNNSSSNSSSGWWRRKPRWLRGGGGGRSGCGTTSSSSTTTASHAAAGGSLWSTAAARNCTNAATTTTIPSSTTSSSTSRNDNVDDYYHHHHSRSDEGVIHVGEETAEMDPMFVSEATTDSSLSAHLQLTHPRLAVHQKTNGSQHDGHNNKNKSSTTTTTTDNGTNNNISPTEETAPTTTAKPTPTPGTVTIHTYHDVSTNTTWKALNTPKRKFAAFLQYSGCSCPGKHQNDASTVVSTASLSRRQLMQAMETTQVVLENNQPGDNNNDNNKKQNPAKINNNNNQNHLRDEWRALWLEGRLLTDRTELLAVYPSDEQQQQQQQQQRMNLVDNDNNRKKKRGGFPDLLHLYTDRLVAILQDELEDAIVAGQRPSADHHHHQQQSSTTAVSPTGSSLLVGWLEKHYGGPATHSLKYENFQKLPPSQQLLELKVFLEWFRSLFPYFYDRCGSCGASFKEDCSRRAASSVVVVESTSSSSTSSPSINNKDNNEDDDDDAIDDREHETFVGYVFPSKDELFGKASRTELYQCHVCNEFTRFPRYNSATHVMDSRRGRCGEYSMLLFRFLRALNHECRWVVDWADHVWAEVLLVPSSSDQQPPRWIHLDPCEAAVDENLIYQGWGKKQTYVLGFYLPPGVRASSESSAIHQSRFFPLIEDITQTYTSDSWEDICQRREETQEEVLSAIENATRELNGMLQEHDEKCKAEDHQYL